MYVACSGVFGCPDTRASANRMRAAAAAANGEFRRLGYPDDAEEALNQAMAYLNATKPYRLSVAEGRAMDPSEMEPGSLLVQYSEEIQKALTPAVSVVLDASGSMLKRIKGSKKRRIEIARASLTELINKGLPANVQFSYRAFGLRPKACDTKAMIKLGKLNKAKAIRAINNTPVANRARTAIAASLTASAGDLANHRGPKVIVLITDGEETCNGDVAKAIKDLQAGGLDVKVQIVGFAIDDARLKKQFAEWAQLGNGEYFDAADSDSLTTSLVSAVADDYSVVNRRTGLTVEGRIGERLTLAPGEYTLKSTAPTLGERVVRIESGKQEVFLLQGR